MPEPDRDSGHASGRPVERRRAPWEASFRSALTESAMALASGESLEEVLDALCVQVQRGIRDANVSVALWDPVSQTLDVVATGGPWQTATGMTFSLDDFSPETRHMLLTGETVSVEAGARPGAAGRKLGRERAGAALGVPLLYGSEFLGLLGIDDEAGRRRFLDQDISLAEALAAQAATAIERARARQEEREQARITDELTKIEADMHSSLDRDRIIQGALESGAGVLGADTGAITLYEPPNLRCVHSVGFEPSIAGLVIPEEKERHSLIAIRTRETVVVEDTQDDDRVDPEHLAAYSVFAVIVVPLVVAGEAFGNIYYNFKRPRSFSRAELRFATRLSSSLSLAMENARLFEAEKDARVAEQLRGARISLLRDVADVGASCWSVAETAQRQLDVVAAALGARSAFVFVLSPEGRTLVPAASVGATPDPLSRDFETIGVDGESTAASAFRTGRPVFVSDSETDAAVSAAGREASARLGQRSGASLPLNVSGTTMGALTLAWPEPRAFDEIETAFLTSLASEIALGLRNAQLFEAERTARQQASQELETTSLLLKAAATLSESMELRQALRELIEIAVAATHRNRITVSLFDPARGELVVQDGVGEGALPAGTRIPLDQPSFMARSIVEGCTTVVDFAAEGTSLADRDSAALVGAEMALLVPLQAGSSVTGLVWVDEPRVGQPFSEREVKIIEGLAAHAATAIERARLYRQRTEEARYAEALNSINAALHSSLDLDEIMERVDVEVGAALDADATAIHLHGDAGWALAHEHGLPDQMHASLSEVAGSAVSEAVVETRTALVINSVLPDYEENASLLEHLTVSALVACPLMFRGAVTGVLYVARVAGESAFDETQIDFVRKVASTLSLALSNAAAYQSERGVAHALQEAMVTLPRSLPGIEFASEYRAASDAALVGGDFYDLFEIDGDLLGITIGDVSGKGLDAAVTTSLVKNAVRAHACGVPCDPARVLELVNTVVHRSVRTGVFSTIFFGVLSRSTGALTYAGGGQVMAMIAATDATVEALHPTGPVLGAYDGVVFEKHEDALGHGCLVLFTDGLTEARHDSEMFGEERLLGLLGSLSGDSPRDVVAGVMAAVEEYTAGHLRDDVALLALRRAPDAASPDLGETGATA